MPDKTDKLNWGVISTGAIAKCFAKAVSHAANGRVLAVASRSQASADTFADEFGIERRYDAYEKLLDDADVQAVYIATPHPFHPEWAIRAAEAGKAVLCEKPAALNQYQAQAMIQAARENGVLFAEAFMYRCHPQTAKLVELIRDGVIGEVRMVRAAFGFGGGDKIGNPDGRLFSAELGGGGILDVGCYPVSFARLVAAAALGKPLANPVQVTGAGRVGETGVDEWAAATLKFECDASPGDGSPSEIIAQVATAVRATLDNSAHIVGSAGSILVPNPWQASRGEPTPGLLIVKAGGKEQTLEIPADRNSFTYEAERFADAVMTGKTELESPAMSPGDTLGNLATLDDWRAAIQLVYPAETPAQQGSRTVANRPLAPRAGHPMAYRKIAYLDKQVSRFVFGCDNQRTWAHASAVFDDWFERGGNAFDTSVIYGGGTMEKLLGEWMAARGVRDQCVVLTKGAHTPRCFPALLLEDFDKSIDRIRTDHTDIYVMHRDNPEVPVGEFVDVINELIAAGRIRGPVGGSNWTIERFAAFNEYAKANGKQPMTVLSNNLSLARMVWPMWGGCLHVSDKVTRGWLAEHGVANFAWSSQARGYFLPEGERMKLGADNFSKWDSEDNRARRARAEELGAKKGVSAINIAAAYVLAQPFPSFALIGPRTIHETATCMPALGIELTHEEVDWLWGEDVAEPVAMTL